MSYEHIKSSALQLFIYVVIVLYIYLNYQIQYDSLLPIVQIFSEICIYFYINIHECSHNKLSIRILRRKKNIISSWSFIRYHRCKNRSWWCISSPTHGRCCWRQEDTLADHNLCSTSTSRTECRLSPKDHQSHSEIIFNIIIQYEQLGSAWGITRFILSGRHIDYKLHYLGLRGLPASNWSN